MRRKILKLANACMQPFGFKYVGRNNPVHMRMVDGLQHIIKKGCKPNTCIDVGVAHGTFPLYEALPRCKHLLIEPLAEYESDIKNIMSEYECCYENAAAGSIPGTMRINVKEQITGSSVFFEQPGIAQGNTRDVSVVTLDDICKKRNLPGPYFVKIDVEGAEMEVIKGAVDIMRETLAFILELTFVARLVDAPEAGEVIRFMAERGFVLYDLFDLRMRDDHTLFQADAIFVPWNSYLRY